MKRLMKKGLKLRMNKSNKKEKFEVEVALAFLLSHSLCLEILVD